MSDDTKKSWQPTSTLEYTVLQRVRPKAYEIFVDDWSRIKRAVKEVIPPNSIYLVMASIFAGVLVSAATVWLSFRVSGLSVPDWARTADICVFWFSLILTALCFLFDWQQKATTNRTVNSVLAEMKIIEEKYENPAVDIRPDSVPN
jgi:hypothetical protein